MIRRGCFFKAGMTPAWREAETRSGSQKTKHTLDWVVSPNEVKCNSVRGNMLPFRKTSHMGSAWSVLQMDWRLQ